MAEAPRRFGQGENAAARLGEVLGRRRSYEDSHLEFDRVLIPGVLCEVGSISGAERALGIGHDRLRRRLVALGLCGNDD